MERLFILPFDHRSGIAKQLLGIDYPIKKKSDVKRMTELKQMVYEAVLMAQKHVDHPEQIGILVEEEFGASILRDAKKRGVVRAVTVEKTGRALFEMEYGQSFAKHLKKYTPDYAKVLIRYDHADKKGNAAQNARLKKVSDFCHRHDLRFMLEVLLTGKGSRLARMKKMISTLERQGIRPDVWKLEGLEKASDWKHVARITKGDLIILGHGSSKKDVERWVREAAKSGVVKGFAIGRTVFFRPLKEYLNGKRTRTKTIQQMEKKFLDFIHLFETSSSP